jgi:hypothetical protein
MKDLGEGMRLRMGDRLRCSNPGCGLQVIVTELGRMKEFTTPTRCSCGFQMKKFYEKPVVHKTRLSREARVLEGIRHPRP